MKDLANATLILGFVILLVWLGMRQLGATSEEQGEQPETAMDRANRSLSLVENRADAASNALVAANYGLVGTELDALRKELSALRAHVSNLKDN